MTSTGKLYGLVLAGGLSTRMKTDKGLIAYHGVPQRTYLYKLLKEVCDEAYISIRKEQENEFTSEEKLIIDEEVGDILGAHMIGSEVTELLGELSLARLLEGTNKELGWMVHPHPTISETIKEAALDADGEAIHLYRPRAG